ncbi:fumarate reductase cytochrome b-556 subunit [Campylobacter sputorum subsp. bubulus]|uniref:Fumarate reductase cytochrome b subunit n=1 Tax=Campylobacter sputorum subsp. sputorum TaxID=32024 RepID=A0A381DLX7_9BACT|nr:fumarate reductase cytochrome b subunit [Campylobacter sputorum]ASM34811.1 fumarate reductase, cytochrome b subunit [Campylobacter sputorum aubsp. sputorum RM3237]KAB0581633.1 fumarate reductase cytochrome b subunit [Campylobacter sputorum subsp. sputorum]QEL05004.1 fumarate reductase, cytochrome b subunit [Campylobacter sputorum subsp. sputorum]SUX10167.1 fumarate reductase cytochrome b-556 subunit [Campylobacter sputorum subsp. bubulus]SUX11491.1 fumarate reductase cytochrome b-556 subuni
MVSRIEGFLGKSIDGKKSRVPAKLDLLQSGTGLVLGLFMWLHMCFVATILVSEEFYSSVVHILEARFLYDSSAMSYVTSFLAACVLVIFFIHAALGMRKMPINFRQWEAYRAHMSRMKHSDTTLWLVQAVTGFVMFFLGSAHLIIIITNSDKIADGGSAIRVASHFMWAFYAVLLFAVELHGSIGLYRLCVKWGWFEGKNAKESRKKLKKAKWIISIFFLVLGILSLLAFMKLGFERM